MVWRPTWVGSTPISQTLIRQCAVSTSRYSDVKGTLVKWRHRLKVPVQWCDIPAIPATDPSRSAIALRVTGGRHDVPVKGGQGLGLVEAEAFVESLCTGRALPVNGQRDRCDAVVTAVEEY